MIFPLRQFEMFMKQVFPYFLLFSNKFYVNFMFSNKENKNLEKKKKEMKKKNQK